MSLLGNCFRACSVLIQLAFNHGKGLWPVENAWLNRDVTEPGSADAQVPLPDAAAAAEAAASEAEASNVEDAAMEDDR